MGDSFCNIYSLAEMGWGDSAGFAEHLSLALGQPIDRLVINAGGAYSARQELVRQLASGRDRLAGKRVVLYQFAARELAFGDWKLFDLPAASAPRPRSLRQAGNWSCKVESAPLRACRNRVPSHTKTVWWPFI